MDNKLLDVLKEFISDLSGIDGNEIFENTSLEGDLGIYGDDAVELILAFGKKFSVDVSKFRASEYFISEGGFKIGSYKNVNLKELKVFDLIKAVEIGRLDDSMLQK